ncbi:MAG: 50S ribosome-binding GTPase [Verrucomicrobiales bacterium]|nr:50S ribosome-binding GTPase [Verrucomicrobiales bacterium]
MSILTSLPFLQTKTSEATSTVVAIGLESVGKSQLLARLGGTIATSENFRGSTLACNTYSDKDVTWVDTPGIYRDSETGSSAETLHTLAESDQVLLVLRADRAVEQLESLYPMVEGRNGFAVITFADRLPSGALREKMKHDFQKALGVPVFAVDARRFEEGVGNAIRATAAIDETSPFQKTDFAILKERYPTRTPALSILEKTVAQPLVASMLLFLPTVIAVTQANRFADWLYDPVTNLIAPLLAWIESGPAFLSLLLAGDYGLVSMFPFLLLYALPTILVFSVILAAYKSTGLIDRISVALHPFLRPFGIGGRDLVRVMMGFGCNVPAVVASRSCASCSRGACVSAISFGSACSYQLPATLAVFAAAGMSGLGVVYLVALAITTLIYLRFTTPKALRLANNQLLLPETDPLQTPSLRGIIREVRENVMQFVVMAFPVFAGICFVAASLAHLGVLDAMTRLLSPVMALFRLPGEAATSVVLGSIRKDGIAIGLLDNDWYSLKVGLETPSQVLTVVYLAGVLLPCLVTLFTIGREMRWTFAARLCLRQMAWAAGFALVIAWVGALFA